MYLTHPIPHTPNPTPTCHRKKLASTPPFVLIIYSWENVWTGSLLFFKLALLIFLQVYAQKSGCIDQICTKMYKWKILHRANIYKYFQMGRKSTRIEQMDFTSFFRTPALPNGGSGSILLFTIGNNTVVFPAEQSSSCFCLFHLPSHRLQQAAQKLSAKTIRTTNQTFSRANCCFVFLFPVKK